MFLTKDARLVNLSGGQVAFTDLRPGSFVQIHSASASAITRDGDTCPSLGVSHVTVIVMNPSQSADGPGEDSGAHIPQGDTTASCAAVVCSIYICSRKLQWLYRDAFLPLGVSDQR